MDKCRGYGLKGGIQQGKEGSREEMIGWRNKENGPWSRGYVVRTCVTVSVMLTWAVGI
jgi:hypothetical protein